MRVPVQIPIGGRKVRVHYVDTIESRGETISYRNMIVISTVYCRSAKEVMETLFHEILHVALEQTGHAEHLGRQEEPVVYGLEHTLAPLFVFNPAAAIKWREVEFDFED